MGQFPMLPPNHHKFSINLLGHVAELVGFLTWDPLLIWNTVSYPRFLNLVTEWLQFLVLITWLVNTKSNALQAQHWINVRHVCQWIVSLLIPYWFQLQKITTLITIIFGIGVMMLLTLYLQLDKDNWAFFPDT